MLRGLFGGRTRVSLVDNARDEVVAMLSHCENMFDAASLALLSGEDVASDGVRAEDRLVHNGERLARRLVATHLAADPDQDLPASLALLSITHNAERIGDYAKSLLELTTWSDLCSADSKQGVMAREIHQMILPMFGQTISALRQDDPELAADVMRNHAAIKKRTDAVLAATMADPEADRGDFLYTIASRFLRRVSAHLSNIASSIVNPLDQISHNEGADSAPAEGAAPDK